MLYYEAANLVTVTKMNMIYELPCAYGTLDVSSGPIDILLIFSMNTFRGIVTGGRNTTLFIYHKIPTEREETAKPQSQETMHHDSLY